MKRLGLLTLLLLLSFVLLQAVVANNADPPGLGLSEAAEAGVDPAAMTTETRSSEIQGGEDPPGGYISPAIDGMVKVTIIPLLVLVLGLFWKGFDKNRFTKLLLQLWGLIKDADNFFTHPNSEMKNMIELSGLNAAKKMWVTEQAVKTINPDDVSYLKKKTGSLGNAIELAINVFKTGAGAIAFGKKVINVFK